LKAFELAEIPEPVEELRDIMQIQRLYESIDFNRVNFEKRIATEFSKKKSNLKANGIQQG
jgi:hypothetical protein